ncbi:MAG: hypothetical protein R2792_00470 [Saprospiraceae bacterium]|jgi:hypothetical protein
MKQKTLRKAFLSFLVVLSIGSFIYVNADACISGNRGLYQTQTQDAQVELTEAEEDSKNIPVPSISILQRLLNVAQKSVLQGH